MEHMNEWLKGLYCVACFVSKGLEIAAAAWNQVVGDESKLEAMKKAVDSNTATAQLEVVRIANEMCTDTTTDEMVSAFWADITAILGTKL